MTGFVLRKRPTNGPRACGLICLDDLRNWERRYRVGCAATVQGSSASTSGSVVACGSSVKTRLR